MAEYGRVVGRVAFTGGSSVSFSELKRAMKKAEEQAAEHGITPQELVLERAPYDMFGLQVAWYTRVDDSSG